MFVRKIGTFWFMGYSARRRHIEALILPLAIWVGFRLFGVARTQAILRKWAIVPKSPILLPDEIRSAIADCRRAQRTIRNATRAGGTCLVRSLTLWAMLRRRGIPTDLRVGMRKSQGLIEGHAWLEYRGQPINEDTTVIATYSVLAEPAAFDL
jgi:hypothetical protein